MPKDIERPISRDLTCIESGVLSVDVSDNGAELQRLSDHAGRDYLWHGDPRWWPGRAPLLFPIVGRAPDDMISVAGRRAPMKQHGFARRSRFERVESGPEHVVHRLTDSPRTREVYPFEFSLEVTHRVDGARLTQSVRVENRSRRRMPFGLGFHPAFAWPLPGATGAHCLTLGNAAEPPLMRLRDGLLENDVRPSPFRAGLLELRPELFEEDAMIFPQGIGDTLVYGAESGPRLDFTFHNCPNLGVWQKPGAPFICIEPWHGMAAEIGAVPEITARPCSTILDPDMTAEFGWSVTIA